MERAAELSLVGNVYGEGVRRRSRRSAPRGLSRHAGMSFLTASLNIRASLIQPVS
jgi:hypothetical protein